MMLYSVTAKNRKIYPRPQKTDIWISQIRLSIYLTAPEINLTKKNQSQVLNVVLNSLYEKIRIHVIQVRHITSLLANKIINRLNRPTKIPRTLRIPPRSMM